MFGNESFGGGFADFSALAKVNVYNLRSPVLCVLRELSGTCGAAVVVAYWRWVTVHFDHVFFPDL